MLPKILNCSDKYNPNKTELKEETPEIVGQELTFSLKVEETNRWSFIGPQNQGLRLRVTFLMNRLNRMGTKAVGGWLKLTVGVMPH